MRYQDWDVLLFPADGNRTHVPVKEFRTCCNSEQLEIFHPATPLLSTFIPSLSTGSPFQISLHSWSESGQHLLDPSKLPIARQLWQVKVVIDGVCASKEVFPIGSSWPQVLALKSPVIPGQQRETLKFPPFHNSIASQHHWNASDRTGRIRVELAAGYADPGTNEIVKCLNVVNFAFQPVPLEMLEKSGIAWPNPHMMKNPLHANIYMNNPAISGNTLIPLKHKKAASDGNTFNVSSAPFPTTGMIPSPVTSPLNTIGQYPFDPTINYDTTSRSTSAYSNVSDSATPLLPHYYLPNHPLGSAYPSVGANTVRKQQPVPFRLPTDQLQMILNAMNPSAVNQTALSATATMPPPPLPAHAVASKDHAIHDDRKPSTNPDALTQLSSNVDNFTNRREQSRYSDISMHAGCDGFPNCTSEDANGCLVHNTPHAPATVVKGRKEGSSPTKPRDFFSTILANTTEPPTSTTTATPTMKETNLLSSSPADAQGKKRTRSALKALNINDGCPEKNNAAKPPRKASKSSICSFKSDKENAADAQDVQENMILDL